MTLQIVDEPIPVASRPNSDTGGQQAFMIDAVGSKKDLEHNPSSGGEADITFNELDPLLQSSLQGTAIAPDLAENNDESGIKHDAIDVKNDATPKQEVQHQDQQGDEQDQPRTDEINQQTKDTEPKRRLLVHTYYAQLSAAPGTEEARRQHVAVVAALEALPGRVITRHAFGMDEDDVLNVVSFKLEGDIDGLEEVAALEGVIGIYPVASQRFTRNTGIDYNHPALGGCFGLGCKVAYGHDFVGDDYDNGNPDKDTPKPDKDPMDCAGHGTHVAGIVAARSEGPHAMSALSFVGVAPDATLGAYRVFGCEGDVSDDILLAALKAAYRDGMDIVNLSLGGSSGWPEEPFAVACSAYIAKGLHVSVANGNDGEEGLFEDGAPATAVGAIAVGSVDNTHFLGTAADLVWLAVDRLGKPKGPAAAAAATSVGRIGMAMAADSNDVPVVSFKSNINYVIIIPTSDPLGCSAYNNAALEKEIKVPRSNIIVILRRGGCTFNDKAKFVANSKLGGMLVYDTVPEQRPLGMAIVGFNISAGGLSSEDAAVILDALKAKDTDPKLKKSGRQLIARFSDTDQVLKLASGGKISDFSSWGPDARLKYKPDIVAPGGMIYSTFPLDKGGFATLQGTSMASPYMAGVQALFLSKHGKTDASLLLNILQSTARPTVKPGSTAGLTSVFQQGGGLVSVENVFAEDSPTVVRPTALYLNDTQFQKLDHDITFTNPSGSVTRIWTLVHRPALSVNGFEDENNHYYAPVNQSRIRTSDFGVENVVMAPAQLQLAPGATGTIRVSIEPPKNLNIQERWLYSGFLEFQCRTDQGAACVSSLVSYGGMHGRLADIPILNPELMYPALRLERYVDSKGTNLQGISNEVDAETEKRVAGGKGHGKGKGKDKGGGGHKNLFRDRSDRVYIGKGDNDWIQILISVNFPTGLLTIEAESVCDDDRETGSAGGRIRLEIGGSGRSRFQIETEEDLEEAEQVVEQVQRLQVGDVQDKQDSLDPERVAEMKELLARSRELAFMPSGLYMPYAGYNSVMLQHTSSIDEVVHLHREMKGRLGGKNEDDSMTVEHGKMKMEIGHHHHRDNKRQKGEHSAPRRSEQKKQSQKLKPNNQRPCVPRILGLIPDGFNPWSTRSDSAEDNTFQKFSWMGDLLLQNHNAVGGEDDDSNADDLAEDGSSDIAKKRQGRRRHKKKKVKADEGKERNEQELTRDLPNGRYRLVVKVLKPWGVRGRASDVERWSSPIIIIKRKK
ncbi:hypothetical protein BGZ58_004404 [Dissophora ornata]|nr:hypothetical protein BGZ58_004404 [Dissophora ornata]